ncbi:MAG: hypothetical protein J6330_03295 [Clostridia bacterium]|nr:hypothetical protein [Clostridia bacterium]
MNDKKLYDAMGKIDDGIIKDALESGAVKEKNYRLRGILEAVACAVLVCGFVALSVVMRRVSNPSDVGATSGPADGSVTVLKDDTEQSASSDVPGDDSTGEYPVYITLIEPVDQEKLAAAVKAVYEHEGTTATQFRLLDSFDTTVYKTWRSTLFRPDMYFDDAYDPEPLYSEYAKNPDVPVWFKCPYVRYYVAGFPAAADEEKRIVHVDICGDASVSVCGININSTFEEFTQTFTAMGFEVEAGRMYGLPYTTGRMIIVAKRDGMWITLEKESVFALKDGDTYGPDSYVPEYENGIVPAVIRMGVPAAGSYLEIEQYDMP